MSCHRLLAALLLLPLTTLAQRTPPPQDRTALGIEALQHWYEPATGLYQTTGWWNSANALTVLVDSMRAGHSQQYAAILDNTFAKGQLTIPVAQRTDAKRERSGFPGFVNRYYDDEGWWALAWIDSYDLTHDPRYLSMAQSIFADMSGGWDETCGGGIWWSKDRNYKNAIANELFFSVAAHLATRATAPAHTSSQTPAHTRSYAQWADDDWQWFQHSGMINSNHLVNDGLTIDPATKACRNNGKTEWTYNQGVVLGALAERSSATHDPALLKSAREIADAAITHLADDHGILHDTCEPNCGEDGVSFKGIFMRNLGQLNADTHEPRYASFLTTNADSIWTADQAPNHQFGVVWSGPPSTLNAAAQSSALDALIAASQQSAKSSGLQPPR